MQKAWKTMHKKWHHINAIPNYNKKVLRLRLILLNWHLSKKWEARRVPTNDTDWWNCLSEKAGKAIPLSSSISHSFCYWPSLGFFLPAARPHCHLPRLCHHQALLNPKRAATGGFEPRPLLRGHQNCLFPRCPIPTNTQSVWVLRI